LGGAVSDERPIEFVLTSFILPSEAAAERQLLSAASCWANTASDLLGGRTPWEVALTPAGHREVEALLRDAPRFPVAPELVGAYLSALLPRPASGARLVEAFDCGGGLLNLFNPSPTPEDDERWPALLAGLPEGAGEAALVQARSAWNHTPNEVLADLTPAQVWAGTGAAESGLITDFLRDWTETADPEGYESPGHLLREALLFLRRWQLLPRREKLMLSAVSIVRAERDATYKRKRQLLKALERAQPWSLRPSSQSRRKEVDS